MAAAPRVSSLGNAHEQDHVDIYRYIAKVNRNVTVVRVIASAAGHKSVAQCDLANGVQCLVLCTSAVHVRGDIDTLLDVMPARPADVFAVVSPVTTTHARLLAVHVSQEPAVEQIIVVDALQIFTIVDAKSTADSHLQKDSKWVHEDERKTLEVQLQKHLTFMRTDFFMLFC